MPAFAFIIYLPLRNTHICQGFIYRLAIYLYPFGMALLYVCMGEGPQETTQHAV